MRSFHGEEKRLEAQMRLAKKELSPKNYEIVSNFKKKLLSEGVGKLRIARYISILREVAKMHPADFDKWDEEDIITILAAIEERDYKQGTKNEFKKALKKFVKFQYGEFSPLLRLIKQKRDDNRVPEVLREEDVLKMIEAASHPRDKALIAVGYEGGLRIGELASLRIGDVIWSSKGEMRAKIKVRGKTGERVIPLIMSAPYLRRWIEEHPFRDNVNAILFCSLSPRNYGGMIGYQMMWKLIVSIGKKAGLKKRVNPHMLRHSRATVLANYLTEAQMCQLFGWTQGSKMPKVYVHLSGRDIDKAILRIYGFEDEEEKEAQIKPRRCPRCGHLNAPTDVYCGRCALILDEGERMRFEVEGARVAKYLLDAMIRDPTMVDRLKEMIELVEKMRRSPEAAEMIAELIRNR